MRASLAGDDRPVARWFAAAIAIFYGFAKLNGSQFTTLLSELDKPMGTVSGFWLTWYHFGYSPVYGTLIALLQIGAGLLLTVPRFTLLGALLLVPLAVNIVLVDLFYGVDLGGLLTALLLLALLLAIVAPHTRRLVNAVVPTSSPQRASRRSWVPRAALLLAAFGGTWWIANVNNRAPTDIDGAWTSTVPAPTGPLASIEKVFFERDRAGLAVVKTREQAYEWRHFSLGSDGRVQVWETWLQKGPLLYEGRYSSAGGRIRLWPAGADTTAAVILELQR